MIEASVYMNLIFLSAASLADAGTPAFVDTMVAIVFVTLIGVMVYHFHTAYTAKSSLWLKIKVKILASAHSMKILKESTPSAPIVSGISSHDPHKIVSKSVVELREPLLDN